MQRTNFPFEVIVHDDASTDRTQEIIGEYARKYPNIIKAVFQEKNQYSKGKKPSLLSFQYARGEYVAICEGDDFWIANDKLQLQFEAAKSSGCRLVFTSCLLLCGEKIKGAAGRHQDTSGIISHRRVVFGGGYFCPTASLFLERSVLEELSGMEWFQKAPVGDLYIQAFAALKCGAFFLDFESCVYRVRSRGSWTSSKKSQVVILRDLESHVICINELSSYFGEDKDVLFSQMMSKAYYNSALALLEIKEGSQFDFFIRLAKEKAVFVSKGLLGYYLLRRVPMCAYFLLKLSSRIL
jgi:glycosyltransferase involved in cell wall biosynthesis